jgi:mono/diheme cytochrome c family protein
LRLSFQEARSSHTSCFSLAAAGDETWSREVIRNRILVLTMLALAGVAGPFLVERPSSAAENDDAMASLMATGEEIFGTICAACHAANGRGDIGPSLRGNGRLANTELVVRQITFGGDEMPGFSSSLSPEEIAAVATFVRNSWGNEYGIVEPPAE